MIMFARLGKGTRKFGEPETPDFALAGAKRVSRDFSSPTSLAGSSANGAYRYHYSFAQNQDRKKL